MYLYLLTTNEPIAGDDWPRDAMTLVKLGLLVNRNVNSLGDLHKFQGVWANVLLAHSVTVSLIHAVGGVV